MKEAFELLDQQPRRWDSMLMKTQQITVAGHGRALVLWKLIIQEYTFERIHQFVYLGSFLTNANDNGISPQVEARLCAAGNIYYGLQRHLWCRLLSRRNKIVLYKTLTYSSWELPTVVKTVLSHAPTQAMHLTVALTTRTAPQPGSSLSTQLCCELASNAPVVTLWRASLFCQSQSCQLHGRAE
jgi:hypothetical protein